MLGADLVQRLQQSFPEEYGEIQLHCSLENEEDSAPEQWHRVETSNVDAEEGMLEVEAIEEVLGVGGLAQRRHLGNTVRAGCAAQAPGGRREELGVLCLQAPECVLVGFFASELPPL